MRAPFLLLNKPRGWSLVDTLQTYQQREPHYRNARLGYAGRLDPLAEGLLIALVDDENRNASSWCSHDKRYEFDVLFGVSTDTFDPLGIPSSTHAEAPSVQAVEDAMRALEGTHQQQYPPFSSVRVGGHPAFWWAHRGLLPPGGWPSRERTIHRATLLSSTLRTMKEIAARAREDIACVRGNFRQPLLLEHWNSLAESTPELPMLEVTFAVECSSGTYMRALANELGGRLRVGAIATRIRRTHVGAHALDDAYQFL